MHVDEQCLAPVRAALTASPPSAVGGRGLGPGARTDHVQPGAPPRRDALRLNGDRLALIRKPHFAPGIWRTPGGGVKAGEDFVDGVVREGLEELGAQVALERYLVRAEAVFRFADERRAVGDARVLRLDLRGGRSRRSTRHEIAEARWGTADELAGPIRERLLATGRALWRYRVALHDAALDALDAV